MSVSALSSSALSPLPSALRLVLIAYRNKFIRSSNLCKIILLENFSRKVQIIGRPPAAGIVHDDRLTKAGRFAQFCVPLNNGIKYHLLKMCLYFFNHLIGETKARIIHGQQNAFNVK